MSVKLTQCIEIDEKNYNYYSSSILPFVVNDVVNNLE